MALVKNEIPILEYDTEQTAVINPKDHIGKGYPKRAVMLFMKQEITDFVQSHDCEQIGVINGLPMNYPIYKTIHNGTEIAFVQAPLGGPGAAMTVELLAAAGVEKLIATGCCGALVEDTEGDFFIPVAALRQEGTSYQYLPPAREVDTDEEAVRAIERALENRGYSYRRCKVWTTDALYRETKEMVLYRKEEGYSVVDMECASMAACAKFRNVQFAQLLFTADSLADVDRHDMRNWAEDVFRTALELAMDAATYV